MADYVLSFLVRRLGNLIVDEVVFLFGTQEEVERARELLQWMSVFLSQAEEQRVRDDMLCYFIWRTREAACDIEDIITNYLSAGTIGHKVNLLRRHKVRVKIENAFRRFSDLQTAFKGYNMADLRRTNDQRFKEEMRVRETMGHNMDNDIVGFEKNIDELVASLTSEQNSYRVVAISGMGGIGKTTLARAVYLHDAVREQFRGHFGWAYVSRECQDLKHVWKEILFHIIPNISQGEKQEINSMEGSEITRKLYTFLKETKCLVVLDDVWSTETWDNLKRAFPLGEDEMASKILLTTRNKAVASHADALIHELQPLDDDKSWTLFKNKARCTDVQRMEVGRKMVGYCAGLPFAIKLLGGILSQRNSVDEWETVRQRVKTLINKGENEESGYHSVSWVLSLSYYELPRKLRPCFLFLANFPDKCKIRVRELCWMWMAEGFMPSEVNANPFYQDDAAFGCLDQLVRRYMVQIEEMGSTGRIKTIRIHDLVRDFCLLKAEEEKFLEILPLRNRTTGAPSRHKVRKLVKSCLKVLHLQNRRKDLSSKVRRLAIQLNYHVDDELARVIASRHSCLRSLLICSHADGGLYGATTLERLIDRFRLLRILKIENVKSMGVVELPKTIERLVHLRLLSLQRSHIGKLTSAIGNLRRLMCLDFRTGWPLKLPNMSWNFEELRHLYFPQTSSVSGKKLRLINLTSLQTLVNISTKCWDLNDLLLLTNLRKLKICVSADFQEFQVPTDFQWEHLQSFALTSDEVSGRAVDITRIISHFPSIRKLHLELPITALPDKNQLPGNLIKLTLHRTVLDSDPMLMLGKLQSLQRLVLSENSFKREVMICSKGDFRQLLSLRLIKLGDLIEWTVEEEALQTLCHLHIEDCKRLIALPHRLSNVNTLKEIVIQSMPAVFSQRLRSGGVDFDRFRHVPSLKLPTRAEEVEAELEDC